MLTTVLVMLHSNLVDLSRSQIGEQSMSQVRDRVVVNEIKPGVDSIVTDNGATL